MSRPVSQGYVDQMLTAGDQARLRSGASLGYGFGNHSDVIVWAGDHFAEITAAEYRELASSRRTGGQPPVAPKAT